ncbi:hypothetical protein FIC_00987 [Flavobacteriaceae bacterium 3519-10]|nr:hypothetical protein FIC_00987 [Flavobacteriaceae bacterium 3519-10]
MLHIIVFAIIYKTLLLSLLKNKENVRMEGLIYGR